MAVDLCGFDGVNVDDVRVVEGGEGLGLAFEPGQAVGVLGDVQRQRLDGDLAAECGVFGPIDRAHTTFAQLGGDSVVTEC